ncbi:MAG: hypothetical protein ABFS23_11385, partial [Pseudomonadota bacterium]
PMRQSNEDIRVAVTPSLACDLCLREIPASECANEEAVDYVLYYFGVDCYWQWRCQGNPRT